MEDKYIVGVDIGGTWVRVALSNLHLDEDHFKIKKVRTPKETKFSISSAVCKMLSELLSENNMSLNQIIGIGLVKISTLLFFIRTGYCLSPSGGGPAATLPFL